MVDGGASPLGNVLMTADTVGGVFTYALTVSRELARYGARVHLATMGEPLRREQAEAARAVPGLVVHESRYRLEWMDNPWDDVARARDWLRSLERAIRPRIVHLNGYCHGDAGFDAPVVIVAHSCVLSWWRAVMGEDAPPRFRRYRDAVARGLAAADTVIAPTVDMLACVGRHYGPCARALEIPNGAAAPRPVLQSKEPFILSAGRLWDRAKNVAALGRVASRVPWPIKIAGWDAPSLPAVEGLGWLAPDRLAAVMERASIFALPARYEPFGLTPLEAALAGCALVLGDIASLREVWGDAALFVRPDDDDALAAALTSLANDADRRDRFASLARARAARYTPARTGAALAGVYRAAIERKAMPRCA